MLHGNTSLGGQEKMALERESRHLREEDSETRAEEEWGWSWVRVAGQGGCPQWSIDQQDCGAIPWLVPGEQKGTRTPLQCTKCLLRNLEASFRHHCACPWSIQPLTFRAHPGMGSGSDLEERAATWSQATYLGSETGERHSRYLVTLLLCRHWYLNACPGPCLQAS